MFPMAGLRQAVGRGQPGAAGGLPTTPLPEPLWAPRNPNAPVETRQDPNTGDVSQFDPLTRSLSPVSAGATGDARRLALAKALAEQQQTMEREAEARHAEAGRVTAREHYGREQADIQANDIRLAGLAEAAHQRGVMFGRDDDARANTQADAAEARRAASATAANERDLEMQRRSAELRARQFSDFMGTYGGSLFPSSGAPAAPAGSGGAVAPTPVAPIAPVDMTAANTAAFARAKDQVGQASASAITGLRSALGGRGMLGSGAESRGTASVINRGLGVLGDVSRTQAESGAALAGKAAETNYHGAIAQRDQDIGAQGHAQELQLERDRLAEQQRQARAASIAGLWKSLSY